MRPDRIVIGCDKPEGDRDVLRALYAPFNRNHERIVVMDVRSAELTKYAANAMLATKISFMNEMANIAERVGADIEMVRHGIGSDPRIGYSFIYPGAGYGGSAFPRTCRRCSAPPPARLRRAHPGGGRGGQPCQKDKLFDALLEATSAATAAGRRIAVWGSPSSPTPTTCAKPQPRLLEQLWAAGASVARL
jgi:UDPglucose 6-dehydrogenase